MRENKKLKLCRDCVHVDGRIGSSAKCLRSQKRLNLVSGVLNCNYCDDERFDPWPVSWFLRKCGRSGRYYKRKL